ncbi:MULTISPECIES: hypothetical protein [unclassified Wolbachia]|nr:hypothetical protein [Wolbachia endosymbiont (group A) of Apoderus coryli]
MKEGPSKSVFRSSHLKWLYLRDRVISVKEKSAYKLEGVDQKDERE